MHALTERALLGTMEIASSFSPHGVEPSSAKLLGQMLATLPSDRAEPAGTMAAKVGAGVPGKMLVAPDRWAGVL
ncbi:MAG: hypothetical protein CYG60_09095 [Actinobacteria bacterium]|nr:hypothetical protein [Actinomycetota bacterium]PLS86091.1 MAG: hypothetical protein CYG60_09095 [Actinomycetota bacterium]